MRITRYGHSCLLIEHDDARLLLDPGIFSQGFEQLRGLTGVLITHQHADHLDVERLRPLLDANPEAQLHCDEGSVGQLADLPHAVVREGDSVELGSSVQVIGSQHAVIHPDLPRIPNVGYLVGGRFFTPGDAFTVPEADVEVLGLPTAAPWLKLTEAVGLLRDVHPRIAFPVHDAVLSPPGLALWYGQFSNLGPAGTDFQKLAPGETLSV
ncbi:MAG: beta-lactamase domain protein [Frankiales bacterium]|nr:beta-lactamase domain protein [Frankiales bacterium]